MLPNQKLYIFFEAKYERNPYNNWLPKRTLFEQGVSSLLLRWNQNQLLSIFMYVHSIHLFMVYWSSYCVLTFPLNSTVIVWDLFYNFNNMIPIIYRLQFYQPLLITPQSHSDHDQFSFVLFWFFIHLIFCLLDAKSNFTRFSRHGTIFCFFFSSFMRVIFYCFYFYGVFRDSRRFHGCSKFSWNFAFSWIIEFSWISNSWIFMNFHC